MVEKEENYNQDVLEIDGPSLQETEAESIDKSPQPKEKQHELPFADNQAVQIFRLPPQLQYEGGKAPPLLCIYTGNRKIILNSSYCKEHIAPPCRLKLYQLYNVIDNDEGLTAKKKVEVPDTSYKN